MTEIFPGNQPEDQIQQLFYRGFSDAYASLLVKYLKSYQHLPENSQVYSNGTTSINLEFLAQNGVDLSLLDFPPSKSNHQP